MWLIPSAAWLWSPCKQSFYGNQGPRVHASACAWMHMKALVARRCKWNTPSQPPVRLGKQQDWLFFPAPVKRQRSNHPHIHLSVWCCLSNKANPPSPTPIGALLSSDLWSLRHLYLICLDVPAPIDYFHMKMTFHHKYQSRRCTGVIFISLKDLFPSPNPSSLLLFPPSHPVGAKSASET